MRREQAHAGEDGQSHREAALAEAQSVHCSCAQYVTVGNPIGAQACNGLGDEEGVAFFHALAQIGQELVDAAAHIAFHGRWTDRDLTAANLKMNKGNIGPAFGKTAPKRKNETPMCAMRT